MMPRLRRVYFAGGTRGSGLPKPETVDLARGVACILLVLFHVIGGGRNSGLGLGDHHPFRYGLAILAYIRMPMFAVISGYVYDYKPARSRQLREFLRNKMRRLALPWIIVSAIFYALQVAVQSPGAPLEFWRIYFFQYEIFWYIQAVLLIFVGIAVLDAKGQLSSPILPFFIVVSCTLLSPLFHTVTFLSIGSAVYLMPFFMAGLAYHRFFHPVRTKIVVWPLFLLALGLRSFEVLSGHSGLEPEVGTMLGLALGLSAAFLVMNLPYRCRLLEHVGRTSLPIFLYHIFFLVAARKLLEASGVSALSAQIPIGLMAGLAGPIVVDALVSPIPIARTILLGLKANPISA